MNHTTLYIPTYKNALKGALIYGIGDLIASLIAGDASLSRFFGMSIVGAIIYAWEIPTYFAWIERKSSTFLGTRKILLKTALALAYFNPLWVSRHILFILLLSGQFDSIHWHILYLGLSSFITATPITVTANWIIQTKITLQYRFVASALFSCAMAIIYPLLAFNSGL